MLFYDQHLLPAPIQPHDCAFCGTRIPHPEFARPGKIWKSADQINVYWFHAGCPVRFKAFNPFMEGTP